MISARMCLAGLPTAGHGAVLAGTAGTVPQRSAGTAHERTQGTLVTQPTRRAHRPHRALGQAAPLRPLPEKVIDLENFRMRRRDHAGGILHEYQQAA